MYKYLFEKLKIAFPELQNGNMMDIYPVHIPDAVLRNDKDAISFSIISSDINYDSKLSKIQISCFSKGAGRSVEMGNKVVKIFNNMRITGRALSSTVKNVTEMLYDKESKYYGTHVEVLLKSTKEFV
jgi:hypothetical protein